MGCCHNKGGRQKENSVSTKAILNPQNFEQVCFYFSTQSLLRIDAQCLVLFCDIKMNLARNDFLSRAGKYQLKKVKQFAQGHLLTNDAKLTHGQVLFFPIAIPTLRFRHVCLVCLEVWDGKVAIQNRLHQTVQNLFSTLKLNRISTIALTQFDQQFGIPQQIACGVLVRGIQHNKQWIKVITFVLQNSSSQTYFMDKVKKIQQDNISTTSKVISQSIKDQSEYF